MASLALSSLHLCLCLFEVSVCVVEGLFCVYELAIRKKHGLASIPKLISC